MKRIALAAIAAAFAVSSAQAIILPGARPARTAHTSRFVAEHVNAILRQKCRPTYGSATGSLELWIHRHALAHRTRKGRCGSPRSISTAGPMTYGQATWYGPGFYGHGNACGTGVLTESSWWVATVPAQCGVMFTICDGHRCVRAPGGDTGGFTPGNFDLTPAVARALGGLYTHSVRWRRG